MMFFENIIPISHMYMHGLRNDLRVKMTELLNVLSIGEDFAISGHNFVCSWPEHLGDDVWPLP
jgi:hypothetical protein